MTRLWPRRRRTDNPRAWTASQDQEVARLTAKADLIVDELDYVVKQMSEMLKGAYGLDER